MNRLKSTFHIISDLHLEFRPNVKTLSDLSSILTRYIPENHKDKELIMAGDIGYPTTDHYWEFIDSCTQNYNNVFIVAGNHEYYAQNNTYAEINDFIKERRCSYPNLHFLINESVKFDNYTIIGSTLWTDIPDDKKPYLKRSMNDYRLIMTKPNVPMTVDDSCIFHKEAVEFLKSEIDSAENDVIIISHHLPTKGLIHPKYTAYETLNCGFYTDLEELMNKKTKTWICGHTHTPMIHDVKTSDGAICRTLCNPIGYPGENTNMSMLVLNLDEVSI